MLITSTLHIQCYYYYYTYRCTNWYIEKYHRIIRMPQLGLNLIPCWHFYYLISEISTLFNAVLWKRTRNDLLFMYLYTVWCRLWQLQLSMASYVTMMYVCVECDLRIKQWHILTIENVYILKHMRSICWHSMCVLNDQCRVVSIRPKLQKFTEFCAVRWEYRISNRLFRAFCCEIRAEIQWM